nr:retrovirus-related Pol polyprotein from transposon TNT 1-94 [Tanacetum cinerariifolium]
MCAALHHSIKVLRIKEAKYAALLKELSKHINSRRLNEKDSKDKASSEEGGFETPQRQRVDYNEIFSPVVKMTTIRLVLSVVASKNLHLEKLDVKTAFLHGDLVENIYMTQPEGFQSVGKEENLMYKLKQSLYGLKQASRQWYLKFDSFMQREGDKEAQEAVVLRIRDKGFRLRKADSKHEHHQI